jgi:hypothetical protein
VIAAVVIFVIATIKIKEFIEIDSCLDNGGKWQYETSNCYNPESH